MADELAFVLINPYTIRKSRTGGIIARYIGRTDLRFVGARMIGPSAELAEKYARLVERADPDHARVRKLLGNYIRREYSPDAKTGRRHRVMLLLFEGENAAEKLWSITGSATEGRGSGLTVRDTYGDYVTNEAGAVRYFEPAVLVSPNSERVGMTLRLWAHYSDQDGGIIRGAGDVPSGEGVEQTLVMLKPDNFKFPSLRAGNIIDILSASGLRIVGVKKFTMTMQQAMDFYGPVKDVLAERFPDIAGHRAAVALQRELGFEVPEGIVRSMCQELGALFADHQFANIVQFICGKRPGDECGQPASESCLAVVYEGVDAVRKIRDIIGPTDPSKARPGSVRREFGSNIMMNAVHASDSVENAQREIGIIDMQEDTIQPLVSKYFSRI